MARVLLPLVVAGAPILALQLPAGAATATAAGVPVGFYPGDGTAATQRQELASIEAWLGRPVETVVLMTDSRSTEHFDGGVSDEFASPSGWRADSTHHLVVSVPLAFGLFNPGRAAASEALTATASGRDDDSYRTLAQDLVGSGHPDAIIRLGWEYDGSWMPWSASSAPATFIAAYRHVHDVFSAVSKGFRFDLCGTAGYQHPSTEAGWHGTTDWALTYPGDAYVDIIGLDLYDEGLHQPYDAKTGSWVDPARAWAVMKVELDAQIAFASAHGKRVSYPEWGLSGGGTQNATDHGGDNPTFVEGMVRLFGSLPASGTSLAYQSYFEADPATDGPHRLSAFPTASAAFRSAFGGGVPRAGLPGPSVALRRGRHSDQVAVVVAAVLASAAGLGVSIVWARRRRAPR